MLLQQRLGHHHKTRCATAALEGIFSNMVKPSCINKAADMRLDDPRIDRLADIGDVDQPRDVHMAGLGIDLNFNALPAVIQNSVALVVSPAASGGI